MATISGTYTTPDGSPTACTLEAVAYTSRSGGSTQLAETSKQTVTVGSDGVYSFTVVTGTVLFYVTVGGRRAYVGKAVIADDTADQTLNALIWST